MIVLSWNYRRLENLWAILDLCRLVKEKRPNLVFLMETKLQVHCLESIKVRVGFGSVFVVDCVGQSGGLALMWKGELSVEIQNYSCFHINAIVRTEANSPHGSSQHFMDTLLLTKERNHGVSCVILSLSIRSRGCAWVILMRSLMNLKNLELDVNQLVKWQNSDGRSVT
jgi:hypothetical protein